MSASAEIFHFPNRAGGGNNGFWSNQDIADVYRCLDQFTRQGLMVEAASGMSDEGDPWFAIEDVSSGEALIHVARIDGFFVVHVQDGDSWSGQTLRQALSNVDVSALVDLSAAGHHDLLITDDGDDDKDGTHAFLRIVSAVVAVLTADVIADAVTHDAAASPLLPSSAPAVDDHVVDASKAVAELPAVESSAPAIHHSDAPAPPLAEAEPVVVTPVKVEQVKTEAAADKVVADIAVLPVEKTDFTSLVGGAPTSDVVDTSAKQALIAADGQGRGVAFSFDAAGEHVQVTFEDKVTFVGADNRSDTFLIILTGHDKDLTARVANFEQGHDSLVIERSDSSGTTSAIVTDLGALVANGASQLTVVGQSTVDIHLSSVSGPPVTGG